MIFAPKQAFLKHLYNSGTGTTYYADEAHGKLGRLLTHYIKKGEIVPFWVIPACLSFGELQVLFTIAPREIQQKVYAYFFPEVENFELITTRKIHDFSGYLECIRNLRNIVNHYEPLLPFLRQNVPLIKKNQPSQIIKVINLLFSTRDTSFIFNASNSDLEFNKNNYNKNSIEALNYMKSCITKYQ